MHSRTKFLRTAKERGLGFTAAVYFLGEFTVLVLTFVLHTDYLDIGECGRWLRAAGGEDGWIVAHMDEGPTTMGVQLTLRLLMNYVLVNICLCSTIRHAAMGLCTVLFSRVRRLRSSAVRTNSIPKAPAASGVS